MAHQIRVLAPSPDDLSWISKTQVEKERTGWRKLSSEFHLSTMGHTNKPGLKAINEGTKDGQRSFCLSAYSNSLTLHSHHILSKRIILQNL